MYFSEYLPRLHAVSILVDHEGTVDDVAKLAVEKGDVKLRFKAGEPLTIRLPKSFNEFKLTALRQTGAALSIKLQVEDTGFEESFMNMSLVESQLWSVKDLLEKTPKDDHQFNIFKFRCCSCQASLIDSLQFTRFNDMPSELWAEMMDFWHCHKPHNHEKTTKNYNGNLKPQKNAIIIGNYYLLVNQEIPATVAGGDVLCKCSQKLGQLTEDGQFKLFKWNLALTYDGKTENYPSYLYCYNMILDKINLDAKRKFRVGSYIIWVFNIGLNVAFTDGVLKNAFKVLYYKTDKPPPVVSASEIVIDEDYESLQVEDFLIDSLVGQLDSVNQALPITSRKISIKEDDAMIDYNISYLGLYV